MKQLLITFGLVATISLIALSFPVLGALSFGGTVLLSYEKAKKLSKENHKLIN